ncbi:transmembrane 9 superfamily member 3 [Diutina catenulata]
MTAATSLRMILCWIMMFISAVWGFDFLEGPHTYRKGDKVDLIVNKVESDRTQLPFGWYSLPFVCPPAHDQRPLALSLGEILRGDRKWESNYQLQFGIDQPCARLCDFIARETGIQRADKLIRDGYVVHWEVDGLPGATTFNEGRKKYYAAGFPLGFVGSNGMAYIYNHVQLVFRTHTDSESGRQSIVGFEVYPKSVSNEQCPGSSKNFENFALPIDRDENGRLLPRKETIPWTYSVYWREDRSIDYDRRWDLYYHNHAKSVDSHFHWMSVLSSLLVILLMTCVVTMVVLSMLRHDLSPSGSGPYENSGRRWTQLSSQVWASPLWSTLLATNVAMGVQMGVATFGVVLMFVFNLKLNTKSEGSSVLFDNHSGAFFSLSVFFLSVSGAVSAYVGILFAKIISNHPLNSKFKLRKQVALSVLFAGSLPSMVLAIMLILNFFVWAKKSSNALPFGTIVVFLVCLFAVEIPLGVFGGYLANKRQFSPQSFLVSQASARPIKQKPEGRRYIWITNPVLSPIVFGLFPFMSIYVELTFVFNSVWLEKTSFYYMYGFLFAALVLLMVIVAECTIVAIYVSLASYNDPNWHWLSFRCGASVGVYVFAYSAYYFFTKLDVHEWVSVLIYFGYMALASLGIGVACGALASLTGLVFINRVFGSLKKD